jgi:hypothetical protein
MLDAYSCFYYSTLTNDITLSNDVYQNDVLNHPLLMNTYVFHCHIYGIDDINHITQGTAHNAHHKQDDIF